MKVETGLLIPFCFLTLPLRKGVPRVHELTLARNPQEEVAESFFFLLYKRMFPKDIVYTVTINLSNLLNSFSCNLSEWVAGVEKMGMYFFLCSHLVGNFS